MDVSIRLRQEHDFYYQSFLAFLHLSQLLPFISTIQVKKTFKNYLGVNLFSQIKGLIWTKIDKRKRSKSPSVY